MIITKLSISSEHGTNISHMYHPFSRTIQEHEGKAEALPFTTLRKKPFFSVSGVQRSFQWLEVLPHLAGLNEAQLPDTLEWMGNHSPPSYSNPDRQTDYLVFCLVVGFFCCCGWVLCVLCCFVCLFAFLRSSFCLMKTLLVVSRFKWWQSSISLLEKLQNGLGRLTWWFKGNCKTTFGKR